MPNKNQIKADNIRFRVLRLLQEKPTSSQRDVVKAIGISLGGVNFCLNALDEKRPRQDVQFLGGQRQAEICVPSHS